MLPLYATPSNRICFPLLILAICWLRFAIIASSSFPRPRRNACRPLHTLWLFLRLPWSRCRSMSENVLVQQYPTIVTWCVFCHFCWRGQLLWFLTWNQRRWWECGTLSNFYRWSEAGCWFCQLRSYRWWRSWRDSRNLRLLAWIIVVLTATFSTVWLRLY